jgi:hypothetical protein
MPLSIGINNSPKHNFVYVPLLPMLKRLLGNVELVNHFVSRTIRTNTVMEDFYDAECFGSDVFFQDNPYGLRIHLYCNEFEVCNPIGSKLEKHKMIALY